MGAARINRAKGEMARVRRSMVDGRQVGGRGRGHWSKARRPGTLTKGEFTRPRARWLRQFLDK